MLTPIEIKGKVLKSGMGYSKKETDVFLEEILEGYEILYKENLEMKDKLSVLSEGIQYYKNIEKTLQKTLVLAEKTAEDTKESAQTIARAIEKEARSQAKSIVADAKNELDRIHNQTISLIQQYDKYKAQYKQLANTQVELLESDSFQIHIAELDAFIGNFDENVEPNFPQGIPASFTEESLVDNSIVQTTEQEKNNQKDDVFEYINSEE